MRKIFYSFLLGVILISPIYGQTNFPEISRSELEQYEYTIIYEDSIEDYYLVVIEGVTYIFYY